MLVDSFFSVREIVNSCSSYTTLLYSIDSKSVSVRFVSSLIPLFAAMTEDAKIATVTNANSLCTTVRRDSYK